MSPPDAMGPPTWKALVTVSAGTGPPVVQLTAREE